MLLVARRVAFPAEQGSS